MFSPGICRWLFLLVSLATWVALTNSKEMRVVCYYTNWSVYRPGDAKFSPQNINPYLCTHLIYAFGGFTKENTLKPFDKYQDIEKGGYAKFTGLKTYNKNLKTMLAIGGWNEGSARFSSMVASLERRKEFAKNAIKFLRLNHFDGLDLDWEYPSFRDGGKPRDRDNYPLLIQDLREEFDREAEKTGRSRLLLTVAVPAGIEYINKGFDVPKITRYVDWMNILSYDYHSAFEPSVNHHAPLYSLEEESEYNYDSDLNVHHSIKHYLKNGADPNKLVLGIPTYGRSYTLLNPEAFEIGSPADGPGSMGEATRENGYLAYYEICEYVKNDDWEVEQPNSKVMGPYAFKDNQWVGYDDEEIVKRKAEYVAENNLGGIMFWSIDNDDFRGKCHDKPYPLIEAGRAALLAAYGATDDNLVSPTRKPVKSRTRTRTKTLNKVESSDDEKIEKSDKLQTRRRNRIRPSKSKEVNEEETTTKRKTRRKELSNEETSSYSSLKVVTPSYTTPAPPATPDVDGEFKCEEDGFYPHPKDCKKYYWCLSGPGDSGIVAHQFTCPAGLYFNKAADSCDYTQNVLCNKKMEKVTDTSYPSTSRAPPKITAATSRTTFVQTTTTTTEAYEEDDEEYEDEEIESVKEESEEDPRVIKELIELIKKAGGLEELEKQLKAKEEAPNSPKQSTTKSSLSKSLYERVLSKAIKNNPTTISPSRNTKSRNSVFRNSRGPQSEKTEDDEEKENQKKTDRGKLEYTSVSRFRPSVSRDKKIEEEKEDLEIEQNNDSLSTKKVTDKFPTYTNIRRARVSTTTIKTPINDRNTILGEIPAEDDQEEDDDDEETNDDDDDTEFNKKVALTTKKPNLPQYVNIKRQRPSTTEEVSTALYTEITRGTTAESSSSEGGSSTTSRYKQIRRGTTTVSTKKPNVEEAQTLSTKLSKEETSTPQSSSTESVLGRSSTTETPSNETIEDNRNEYLYNITTTRTYLTTTDDIMNNEKPNTPSKPNLFKTIQRKRPQLFEPRPFSKPTEASTTPAATQTTKVSYEKPTINFRSRGASRFNLQKTSNTTESEVKENTSKRRLIVTEKYIEDHRSYRPSELADLSSLTAVDFDNIKELHAQTGQRRRRPLKPSSTTSTTTQSSLLPYKRRRVNVNLNELSKNPQTTDRNTVIDSLQSTSRNRKIIRRYRPTTTSSTETVKSLLDNNEVDDDSFEDTSTEEYENIKLSESNIRENSDINSFQVDPKLKNKFIKTSNLFGKSSVYGEEKSSTVNIVPSTTSTEATSTKKIIPAEPSKITYVDSEKVFGRKRKIIRKFRPHQNTTTTTNVENNTPTINLKEIPSEPTPEKDTPSSNLQNKIAPKRIFRPRDGNRRFTPVTVEPEYSPINKTGLLRGTNKAFRQTTTTTESSAGSQRYSFIPRRTTKQFKSSSTTEATSQIPTTVSEEDVDTTTIKPNTFETTTESSASSQRFSFVPRRSTKQFTLSSTTEATSQHIPITISEEDVDTTTIKPNTFESTTESSASSQRFSFVPTRSTKQFTSSSTTEATSQHIPTTVSEEDLDITTITSNTFEPTTEQIITETILNESTTITTKENDIISKYTDIPDTTENLETTTVKFEEFSTENFEQTKDTPTDTTLSIETTTASQNSTTASLKQTSLEYKSNILRPVQSRPKFIPSKLKNLSNNENTETGGFKPRNNYRNRLQSSTSTSTTESTRFFAKSTRRYNKFRPGVRFEKSNNIDSLENSSTLDGNVKVDEDDENIEVKAEESYSVDTVDEIKKAKNKFLPNSFRPTSRTYSKNIFSKAVTEESKIIDEVKDVNTDAVRTKNRNLFNNRKPYSKESEEDGVEDDNDEQKEDEDKISDEEVAVKDEIKTSKRKYLTNISTSTLRPSNKPYYFSKTATEEPKTTEELKDVDTEAVKTRNKNLFNNRKNNLNHSTSPSSLATEETTAPPTTVLTEEPLTYIEEEVTTSQPTESTTLIHIFAEKEETNQTTSNKVERIIEVNRIVNVKSKEDVTDEESTVVDKIGAVNRVTVIKVVDKDGKLVDSNETVSQTTESPIKSSVDMIIQIAKIEEIPGKTMEKINLTSVSVDVNKPATNREDRKLDLQGSKVDFSKNDLNGKAEIFGGLSHINIITPRTVRLTESSTIALEGLFQTEKPNLFTGKNSINEELLETENSKFVNVRVLHPDEGYRINKKLLDQPKIIPIKILKQDDDYVMKAKVVEVSTQSQFNTFKIVPIKVEAAKRLPPPLPLIRINRQYN